MSRFPTLLIAAATALAPGTAQADTFASAGGRYTIQPGSHIGFSVAQVGGGGISGRFDRFSGTFDLDANTPSKSTVSFTLQPASVDAGQARISDFLRSSAVFDVSGYPAISFRSTRVTLTGPDSARIDGVLTARGKSHDETFEARMTGHDAKTIAFNVTGDVLRSPYGMDVGTPIYSNVVKFDMTLTGQK